MELSTSQNLKIPLNQFCLTRVAHNSFTTDAKWNSEMLVDIFKSGAS